MFTNIYSSQESFENVINYNNSFSSLPGSLIKKCGSIIVNLITNKSIIDLFNLVSLNKYADYCKSNRVIVFVKYYLTATQSVFNTLSCCAIGVIGAAGQWYVEGKPRNKRTNFCAVYNITHCVLKRKCHSQKFQP